MAPIASRNDLVEALLQHAARPRHPSHQILDRVERALPSREAAEAYVEVLLDQTGTAHPSLRMLDRAADTVRRMEISHAIQSATSDAGDGEDRKDHS